MTKLADPSAPCRGALRHTDSAGVSPTERGGQQLSWQREMERAQAENWFKPPSAPSRGEASSPSAPRASGREGATSHSQRKLDGGPRVAADEVATHKQWLRQQGDVLQANLAPSRVSPAPPAPADFAAPIPLLGPVQAAVGTLRDAPDSTRLSIPQQPRASSRAQRRSAVPTASSPSSPSSLVHVHREITSDGWSLWVAMRDDPAQSALLPDLVADLRRELSQRGERLHQLVCNGRLVWRAGTHSFQPKEA